MTWSTVEIKVTGPITVVVLRMTLSPTPTWRRPLLVSLNPAREPAFSHVLGRFDYAHPVFDLAALAAQRELPALQGRQNTWFAGAWTRYGFHEDGLLSGETVAQALRERWMARPRERVAA